MMELIQGKDCHSGWMELLWQLCLRKYVSPDRQMVNLYIFHSYECTKKYFCLVVCIHAVVLFELKYTQRVSQLRLFIDID